MGQPTHHQSHSHGAGCGHVAIEHQGHTDFCHGSELHHPTPTGYEPHRIEVSEQNPDTCQPMPCIDTQSHATGDSPAIPHGDHTDYLVNRRLHHVHGDHCDDHGPVRLVVG